MLIDKKVKSYNADLLDDKKFVFDLLNEKAQKFMFASKAKNYFKTNNIEELKSYMAAVEIEEVTNFKSHNEYEVWLQEIIRWFPDAIYPLYKEVIKEKEMDISIRSNSARFLYKYVSCQIVLIISNAPIFDEKLGQNPIIYEEFDEIKRDIDIMNLIDFKDLNLLGEGISKYCMHY